MFVWGRISAVRYAPIPGGFVFQLSLHRATCKYVLRP
jgi:hypothetical protein